MKTAIKYIQIGLLGFMLLACTKDLNVQPNDPFVTTASTVYTTTASYKQGLAKIYASYVLTGQQGPSGNPDVLGVDEGFSSFIRSLWNLNELTTDEALWSYQNDANGSIFNLHHNTWTPSDGADKGIHTALFARITNVVALCNEFLRASASKASDNDIQTFRAEARFLRALAYYYGMDLFLKVPFITEADLPGAASPAVKERAALYEYIETELLAIKPLMGAPRFEYGRADKAACAMLLAKLYLNSEVYVQKARYTDAITQLKEVINSGYTLAAKYRDLFSADNDKNNTEIIFAQLSDDQYSQNYGMPWIMIAGNAGSDWKKIDGSAAGRGWAGMRTTSAFVKLFDAKNTEARALFADTSYGQSLEIENESINSQGYGILKFRPVKADGTWPGTTDTGFYDTDYPMFRLADAYLMYAEAVLRGGQGGDLTTALTYVNAVRNRSGETDAKKAGTIASNQLTLDFILDERGRELYWEGHRRMDLIRFGKYTGDTYLWPWKGGVKNGTGIEAKRAYFPIPSADLASNPNLRPQNDGY